MSEQMSPLLVISFWFCISFASVLHIRCYKWSAFQCKKNNFNNVEEFHKKKKLILYFSVPVSLLMEFICNSMIWCYYKIANECSWLHDLFCQYEKHAENVSVCSFFFSFLSLSMHEIHTVCDELILFQTVLFLSTE